ncbi:MAG TPA: hypothetical protein GX506_11735 [Firmicutes bacterium]|nr:hypothetical protein [Bacillota bacterium]
MPKYIVTNIRFSEDEHKRLKYEALKENRSIADIVREAVDIYFADREGKRLTEAELANDPFFDVIGVGESGIPDNAVRHDVALYWSKSEAGRDDKPEGGRARGGRARKRGRD